MVGAVEAARHAPVVLVAEHARQVLDQRPALRDVHHLHAPADPQERDVALDRPPRERDLEVVALGDRVHRLRRALLAVEARVDVGAAREQQPVDEIEHEKDAARRWLQEAADHLQNSALARAGRTQEGNEASFLHFQ